MTSVITKLVLDAEPVLRLFEADPWGTSLVSPEIAKTLGRDPSNTNKTLKAMVEASLLATHMDAGKATYGVTHEGVAAIAALNRAAGSAAPAAPVWPHDKIVRNPANPRKTFPDEKIAEIAESIVEVGGLLHNLVLRPADASGVRMLHDGECRWRACGLLVDQGRLPPALADGLPYTERAGTEEEALLVALIANAQRGDLSPWEDAQGLKAFKDLTGLSARAVAFRLGRAREGSEKGVKDVQEKIKTAAEATPANIALHESGVWSWEQLRESVRVATPAAETPAEPEPEQVELEDAVAAQAEAHASTVSDDPELSDFAWMMLLEIFAACQRRPFSPDKGAMGPTAKMTQSVTVTDKFRQTEAELVRNGLVFFHSGWPACVTLLRPGEILATRQAWTGPLERRLLKARMRADHRSEAELVVLDADGKYLTDWLNVAPDPVPTQLTDAQALVLLELWDSWVRTPGSGGYDSSKAGYYGGRIHPDADRAVISELEELQMIEKFSGKPQADGALRLKPKAWSRPSAKEALAGRWSDFEGNGPRAKALFDIRCEVLGAAEAERLKKAKTYATTWLNGPFPISDEIQKELDAAAAKKAQQEAAAEAERIARENANRDADAAVATLEAEAASLDLVEIGRRVAAMLDKEQASTPWTPLPYSFAQTASGKGIEYRDNEKRIKRLGVLAINALTGRLLAPQDQASKTEAFIGWIAGHLVSRGALADADIAREQAGAALKRYLADNDVEFGDDAFDWDDDTAGDIATDWAEDFLQGGMIVQGPEGIPVVCIVDGGSVAVPEPHWPNPDPWIAANIVDGEYVGPIEVEPVAPVEAADQSQTEGEEDHEAA